MYKINPQHLEKFSFHHYGYHYQLDKGVLLTFDDKTLEFIGVNYYFLPKSFDYYERKAEELLDKLYRQGILEIEEGE